jgi:hypothetical protein
MNQDTFRVCATEMKSVLTDHYSPFIQPEGRLPEYNRFANAPEESHCTDKESTQKKIRLLVELVEKEIVAVRNKIIDISVKISEDEVENRNAFMNMNLESVTEADTQNGIFVNLCYLAISLGREYKALYKSTPEVLFKSEHNVLLCTAWILFLMLIFPL